MPDPFDQSSPGGQNNVYQNLMNFGAATMANSAGAGAVTDATAIGKGLMSAQESARSNTKARAEAQELGDRGKYYGAQNYLASMQGKMIDRQMQVMQKIQDLQNEQTDPSSTAQDAPAPRESQGMTGMGYAATPGSTRLNSGAQTNAYPAGSSGEPAPRDASFMPPQNGGLNPMIANGNLPAAESGNDPNAVSPKGAAGAFQIMPGTARDPGFGVKPLQNWDGKDPRTAPPAEQQRFANDYLNAIQQFNGGSPQMGAASYNAGPNRVNAALQHLPQETQAYVQKVAGPAGQPSPGIQLPGPAPQEQPRPAPNDALFNRAKLAKIGMMGASVNLPGAEKLVESTKPPAGYEMTRNGDFRPIKGGPEDPDVKARNKDMEERAGETAKSSSALQKELMEGNNNALQTQASLNQMGVLMKDMSPGKLNAMKKAIADWKVGLGEGSPEDVKLAAATEGFDKETAKLAVETLRQFTSRGTQMEFKTFLANNPNAAMTPGGIRTMLGFMQKSSQRDIDRYAAFQDFRKTAKSGDELMNFPVVWAKHLAENPNRYTQTTVTASQEEAIAQAKQAIAQGAPRKKVIRGLQTYGYDTGGL